MPTTATRALPVMPTGAIKGPSSKARVERPDRNAASDGNQR